MTLRHRTSRLPGTERVRLAVQIIRISSLQKDAFQVPQISLPFIPTHNRPGRLTPSTIKFHQSDENDGSTAQCKASKSNSRYMKKSQRPFKTPPNVSEEEAMNLRYAHKQQAIIGPKEAENHFKGMFVDSRKYASKDELFTTMKESVTNDPVHLAMFEKWYKERQSIYDGCV
jgi:hypothetical protein